MRFVVEEIFYDIVLAQQFLTETQLMYYLIVSNVHQCSGLCLLESGGT